jgi:hypothetical protein
MKTLMRVLYTGVLKPAIAAAMHAVLRYPSIAMRVHSIIMKWPRLYQFLLGLYAETLSPKPANEPLLGVNFDRKLDALQPGARSIFEELRAARNRQLSDT